MSWGDTFINGFSAVTDAKEKKKRREQEERLTLADQTLRKQLQDEKLKADLDALRSNQGFSRAEREAKQLYEADQTLKDRTWRTGERLGGEQFTGTQAEADRRLRQRKMEDDLRLNTADQLLKERMHEEGAPERAAKVKYWENSVPRRAGTVSEQYDEEGLLESRTVRSPLTQRATAPSTPPPAAMPTMGGEAPRPTTSVGQRAMHAAQAAGDAMAANNPFGQAFQKSQESTGRRPFSAAIEYLRKNPQTKAEFEARFGPGSAAQYILP